MFTTLQLPQTRWGAFGGHLALSVAIFAALFALIAFVLFPGALFHVAGGLEGIRIIAGVDLVLGPLLTLIIYNVSKPRRELYRDLAVIAAIQIGALAAGMAVVYASRPAVVAWVYDKFETVKASEVVVDSNVALHPLKPTWVAVDLPPDDADARQVVAMHAMSEEGLRQRGDLYLPLPPPGTELERFMRGKGKSGDACLEVDIATAFDARRVCFDAATPRLFLKR